MPTHTELPGVLFTMRYPDDTGYVWNYIASVRDRAAEQLRGIATPYMAFPQLTGNPSYPLQHLTPVELDCYDNSPDGREAIDAFVRKHNIKVVVFMSALPSTVCLACCAVSACAPSIPRMTVSIRCAATGWPSAASNT